MEWLAYLPAFLLVLTRITAFFVTIPIFSSRTIPRRLKIGLALFLAAVVTAALEPQPISVNGTFFLLVLKEALIGLLLGLIVMMMIYAIQVAGSFIDLQIGFAIANIIDPNTGIQSPLTGKFLYTLALLFLLSIDAHHYLLDGILHSFQYVPLTEWAVHFGSGSLAERATAAFVAMFTTALQIALPILAPLFITDLGLGLISRAVPQVNVFIVGLPLKALISFFFLLLCMPLFLQLVSGWFLDILEMLEQMMRLL